MGERPSTLSSWQSFRIKRHNQRFNENYISLAKNLLNRINITGCLLSMQGFQLYQFYIKH